MNEKHIETLITIEQSVEKHAIVAMLVMWFQIKRSEMEGIGTQSSRLNIYQSVNRVTNEKMRMIIK